METEHLKYIADVTLQELKKHLIEREGTKDHVRKLKDEFKSLPSYYELRSAKHSSPYPDPGLNILVYSSYVVETGDLVENLYFGLQLKRNCELLIDLIIRWTPLDFQIDTQLKTLRSGLRRTLEKEEESCNNLIIISGEIPLDEIALQIGIYLTRARVIDIWTIYPLFQKVLKTFGVEGEEDVEFFDKLVRGYRVPNHAASFRTYLWMLSKDIKRQTETWDRRIFGVSRNTLYTLIHRGKLKVLRDSKGKYD